MNLLLISILTLSFTTAWAAENGLFMVVKGVVKIETAGVSQDAKVGSKVNVGDTVITENESRAKIVMSDRNIISLSPNTKLKIEKYTNSSSEKNVDLRLIEGKVRNNVEQKYNTSTSKFEVRTATAVAGVRGTQFITSFDKQTQTTEVVTLHGEVLFKSLANQNSLGVLIKKNQQSEIKGANAGPTAPVKVSPELQRELQIDSKSSNDDKNVNLIPNQNKDLLRDQIKKKFDKSKVIINPIPGN